MKIKKVILHNFRAYKHTEFELDNFSCIIGKNDVGKSTIFAALDWFFGNKELTDADFNADNIKKYGYGNNYDADADGDELSVEIHFAGITEDMNNIPLKENIYSFYKDFCNDKSNLCIQKYMFHSTSHRLELNGNNRIGYCIKNYHFESLGKPLSYFKLDELENEYNKTLGNISSFKKEIADNYDDFMNGLNGICLDDEIINGLRNKIFSYYEDKEKLLEIWEQIDNSIMESCILSKKCFPKFKLDDSETPLDDYIKLLFRTKILNDSEVMYGLQRVTHEISSKISSISFYNDRYGNLSFANNVDFEILFKQLLTPDSNIPLQNRGKGFQLKIKNEIFKLLSEQENKSSYPILFAFEEPEIHLHPREQVVMYQSLKELSENPNYQVIITTHSPFIVKELAKADSKILVVKQEITKIDNSIPDLGIESFLEKVDNTIVVDYLAHNKKILSYISMNEIIYFAFDEATEEFHQELFNKIECIFFGESSGTKIDEIFNSLKKHNNLDIDSNLMIYLNDNIFESCDGHPKDDASLCYCVRNAIDHPFEGNNHWKSVENIRNSIQILISLDKNLYKIKEDFIKEAKAHLDDLDNYGKVGIECEFDGKKELHSSVYWTFFQINNPTKKVLRTSLRIKEMNLTEFPFHKYSFSNYSYIDNALNDLRNRQHYR